MGWGEQKNKLNAGRQKHEHARLVHTDRKNKFPQHFNCKIWAKVKLIANWEQTTEERSLR